MILRFGSEWFAAEKWKNAIFCARSRLHIGKFTEIENIHGVHFLHLIGTPSERAAQHGAFARSNIPTSALPVLADKNFHLFDQVLPRPLAALVKMIYRFQLRRAVRKLTADERDLARCFCEAAGIQEDMFWRAFSQPDVMMLLVRMSLVRWLVGELPPMALPGCTSGVALGKHTASGKLIACRNLDYPIVGPWEKNTAVLFHNTRASPHGAIEIPHVTVSSLGFHTSSMSAMNREGLTINLHAHYGKEVSTDGKFITFIGDEVISKARSLDEAVRIVKKYKRIGNWAFVIASARDRDAAVIEVTHQREGIRYASQGNGFVTHSNYFLDPILRQKEAFLSTVINEDVIGRCNRISEILQQKSGRLEMIDFANALGDLKDPFTGKVEVSGHNIAPVTSVASMVFSPEDQEVMVSARQETPTGFGPYVKFKIENFWSNPLAMVELVNTKPVPASMLQSVQEYRKAYQAWHMERENPNQPTQTVRALKKAIEFHPDESNLKLQLGLVLFRAGQLDQAAALFARIQEQYLSAGAREVLGLMMARCHDIQGQRDLALKIYLEVLHQTQDPRIQKECRRALKKPYSAKRTKHLIVDLQFPDALIY